MSEAEAVKEERARQREHQKEQRALQQAFNESGELSRDWMREVLDVDQVEQHLQPNTVNKIQAMLNKQWILANLTEAETHDRVFWLEVMKYKIYGEHPPEGSLVTGATRAFLLDDELEELEPLTPSERNQIDQIINGLKNMVTRSRGGFEREQINTSIARTEQQREEEDTDGGLTGLFS